MPRRTSNVSPERDQRLRRLQTIAVLIIAIGVAILVYLAVATTA